MEISHEMQVDYKIPGSYCDFSRTVTFERAVGSAYVKVTLPAGPRTDRTMRIDIRLESLEWLLKQLRARGDA